MAEPSLPVSRTPFIPATGQPTPSDSPLASDASVSIPEEWVRSTMEQLKTFREQLTISEEVKPLMGKFESAVSDLKASHEKIASLSHDQKDSLIEEWDDKISEIKETLTIISQRWIQAERTDGILDSLISFLEISRKQSSLDFDFCKEKLLNHLTNKLAYLEKVREHVQIFKDSIVNDFFVMTALSIDDIDFKIAFAGDETHNKGKTAAFVEFYSKRDDKVLGKIVYKPRAAEIDVAIIELFRKINEQPHPLPAPDPLPTYKIMMKKELNISFWEYINGHTLPTDKRVVPFITDYYKKEPTSDVAQRSLAKINRMACILSLIKASDFHGENFIYKTLEDGSLDIIPIDLENINEKANAVLQLGAQIDRVELLLSEKALIITFNRHIDAISYRFLPYDTIALMGWLASYKRAYMFAQDMMKKLESSYEFTVSPKELAQKFLFDVLNHDVPYCTIKEYKLYWGEEGEPIAIKKRPNPTISQV